MEKKTSEEIALIEFENVGDEKLFPNHTDKDIWVAGFIAGHELNPWISVKDRLPENDQIIDTWNGKTNRRSNFMLRKFIRHVDLFSTDRILIVPYPDITDWMPLPEKPTI